MTTDLTNFGLDAASTFLKLLDPNATAFSFRTFGDTENVKGLVRNYQGSFESLAPQLAEANMAGAGVFVVVNDGGHRAKDINRVRAVFADLDGAPLGPVCACSLKPHLVVQTSPGHYHAYWLVDDLPLDDFSPLQRAIAARFGGDSTVNDRPRVLRVPGFWNRKKGEWAPVIIESVRTDRRYTGAEVRAEFASRSYEVPPPPPPSPNSTIANASPPTTVVLARGGVGAVVAEARHEDILKVASHFARLVVFKGLSRSAAVAALMEEAARGRWTREVPKEELTRALDGAMSKYRSGEFGMGFQGRQSLLEQPPRVHRAADLLNVEFAPVQWAIEGIIPEGVTILSGDPKIGKSWLVYQACLAVAAGLPFWRGRATEAAGEVLLLALEDNPRRLRRRLDKLLLHFSTFRPTASGGGAIAVPPDIQHLHYATEWPRAETGVDYLVEWLRANPGARLVAIDTVSAFRNPEPGRKSAYATDYAVGEMLKPLSREFKTAILLVMHNRKQASDDPLQLVSGTQGMTGGVDNVIVLRRDRGAMDAGLYVDGRDIEQPQELALRFREGMWSSDGTTVEEAKLSKERRRVIETILALASRATSGAISDALAESQKPGAVRKMLSDMVAAGDLRNEDGVYVVLRGRG